MKTIVFAKNVAIALVVQFLLKLTEFSNQFPKCEKFGHVGFATAIVAQRLLSKLHS